MITSVRTLIDRASVDQAGRGETPLPPWLWSAGLTGSDDARLLPRAVSHGLDRP